MSLDSLFNGIILGYDLGEESLMQRLTEGVTLIDASSSRITFVLLVITRSLTLCKFITPRRNLLLHISVFSHAVSAGWLSSQYEKQTNVSFRNCRPSFLNDGT